MTTNYRRARQSADSFLTDLAIFCFAGVALAWWVAEWVLECV